MELLLQSKVYFLDTNQFLNTSFLNYICIQISESQVVIIYDKQETCFVTADFHSAENVVRSTFSFEMQ